MVEVLTPKTPDLRLLTPDQVQELRVNLRVELARRAAAEKDILSWGKLVFPTKFPCSFCKELHGYLVQTRQVRFTCTESPRDSAKTTIRGMLIPTFQAIEEPHLFNHYLNVQATNIKALTVNRTIKLEFEQNQVLRAMYGDMIGERWTDEQFVLKNSVIFTCISTGQSIRGINYRNHRPDYAIVDDLYNDEDLHNPESTAKKNEWFWSSLYSAMDATNYSIQVIGTAVNNYDLLLELSKRPDLVAFRTFKQVIDFEKKITIWPERKTFDQVMVDKSLMSETIFYRERQNERHDEATSLIKRSWIYGTDGYSWEYDPADLKKRLAQGAEIYLVNVREGVDPSIGKNDQADETGYVRVAVTRTLAGDASTEYWIDGIEAGRHTLQERTDHVRDMAVCDIPGSPPTEVCIETIGAFDDFATYVEEKTHFHVTRTPHVVDKIANLENNSRHFQNRKVHINKNIPQPLKDKLVYQLTTNVPRHDDVRDGLFQAMNGTSAVWSFMS